MDKLTLSERTPSVTARLGEHRRTLPASELEVAAVESWRDEKLRELGPQTAASHWLALVGHVGQSVSQ